MRIARFSLDGNVAFGAVEGEESQPDALLIDIIKGIPFADFDLSGTKVPLSKVRLLPPVLPSKVVAIGRNYAEHAAELGNEVPDAPVHLPQAVHLGDRPRRPDRVPRRSPASVHHEARTRRRHRPAVPRGARGSGRHEVILGYTCANDVTARDVQQREGQWARAKGFDTVLPARPVDRDRPRPGRPGRHLHGQRRAAAGRPHQRDDPRHRRPDRQHHRGHDPAARRRASSPAPRPASARSASATRSPSPSKASARSPTR